MKARWRPGGAKAPALDIRARAPTRACARTYRRMRTHARIRAHMHMHADAHAHAHARTHARTHAHTHIRMLARTHARARAHTHAHTCRCTHTQARKHARTNQLTSARERKHVPRRASPPAGARLETRMSGTRMSGDSDVCAELRFALPFPPLSHLASPPAGRGGYFPAAGSTRPGPPCASSLLTLWRTCPPGRAPAGGARRAGQVSDSKIGLGYRTWISARTRAAGAVLTDVWRARLTRSLALLSLPGMCVSTGVCVRACVRACVLALVRVFALVRA